MNRERATIRARSIVGLYREQTIGSLPIEEVRLDLDRLGVASAEVIDLSRRLASGGQDDPASELLVRLEQAEAVDCEIADLERQSMQSILDALPPDLMNSLKNSSDDLVATTVPGQVGEHDKNDRGSEASEGIEATEEPLDALTGSPNRRRRAVFGIGGTAIAVAASVLLMVALRPDVIDQFGWPATSGAEFSDAPTPIEGRAENEADAAKAETALAATEEAASSQPPSLRQRSVQGLPIETVPLPAADELSSALHDLQQQGSDRARAPVVSALVPDEPSSIDQARIRSIPTGVPEPTDSLRDTTPTNVNGWTTLPDDLIGVFILDAERAPASLVALELAGRDNRLGAKRGEASLRALGRHVLALIAFEREGERVEAAVIEVERRESVSADRDLRALAEVESASVVAPGQPSFELLELSRVR